MSLFHHFAFRQTRTRRAAVFVLTGCAALAAMAQPAFLDIMARESSDFAEIRRHAEAGDAAAEVRLGEILASRLRFVDAMAWFRKAADQGNIEGQFHAGNMLLRGAYGGSGQIIKASPAEALPWTFKAATRGHAGACGDMSYAYQNAAGVDRDLVSGYAWLQLCGDLSPGMNPRRYDLNELALRMSTADVDRAKALAAKFKSGQWQFPVLRAIPNGDPRLKLNGITISSRKSLAIINGQTVSEGETFTINLKPDKFSVKCLKIDTNSVLIMLEEESQPRELKLTK